MLLSTVSVLVVAQSSSEIPEGLMNNPVLRLCHLLYRAGSSASSVMFLKVKVTLFQATKAQSGSKGRALLFL